MKTSISPVVITIVLVSFALAQQARAQGCNQGCDNSHNNTFLGFGALQNNVSGDANTGIGWEALNFNTTGILNTAAGFSALSSNTTGGENTATGSAALASNTTGSNNTAIGRNALANNITASNNTATAVFAPIFNETGYRNTATRVSALQNNIAGHDNTAIGFQALYQNNGSDNVALGLNAGNFLTTGSGNVCIGYGVLGVAGESNTTHMRNVYSSVAFGRAVYVNLDNKIGTLASTRRVKNDIKAMDKASEAILALKPVSFRYKKEIDASGTLQFGLVAEEVADINADLVTRDSEGKPETVRYDAVNAMLLNEFLKEHRKNEEQQKQIDVLTAQIKEQASQMQKVSAQLEVNRQTPQVVSNNHYPTTTDITPRCRGYMARAS
jgi:Chaperone of endosialidase